MNTTALSFSFENLQPETLYEIVLSASGPGGNETIRDKLVFSTKSAGTMFDKAKYTKAMYIDALRMQTQLISSCWLQLKPVL